MKEKAINLQGWEVKAILERGELQLRRVVKVPAPFAPDDEGVDVLRATGEIVCPYGQPGDRLWVRETWFPLHLEYATRQLRDEIRYKADGNFDPHRDCVGQPWRPSVHMPRWASRLTLEVVSVAVEQIDGVWVVDVRRVDE